MGHPAHPLFTAALALPEEERLELASELLASDEDPQDDAWQEAWIVELERRERAVSDGGPEGSEWSEVRVRLLAQLGRR
jgi:hypothetical protein